MKNRWIRRWLGCLAIIMMAFSGRVEASSPPFKDVTADNPYQVMIQDMRDRKLINGYPNGEFKPNERIARKHVAKLLTNALKLEAKTGNVIHYNDVPKTHPYYNDITRVSQAGIFNGDSNGNFNPDAPLTRIQMAKVLDSAFNLTIKSHTTFPDVQRNHWGYTHVQALYSNGITTADQGYFKPNQPVTRAHYAVFLYRSLHLPEAPKSLPHEKLKKEEIKDLVFRLPIIVETTLVDYKMQASPFSVARSEILKNATPKFTDTLLKKYYNDMCIYCDMTLFPFLMDEPNYRFEILENTPNLVRMQTVSFAAPLKDSGYVEYTFEKQSNKWKLAGYEWQPLGAGNFNLTKEEALRLVKKEYLFQEAAPIEVTFLDSGTDNVFDWYTNKEYPRLVYRIHVDTGTRNFNVVYYPHNGSHHPE